MGTAINIQYRFLGNWLFLFFNGFGWFFALDMLIFLVFIIKQMNTVKFQICFMKKQLISMKKPMIQKKSGTKMTSIVSETLVLLVYWLFQWFYKIFVLVYGFLWFFISFNNIWTSNQYIYWFSIGFNNIFNQK